MITRERLNAIRPLRRMVSRAKRKTAEIQCQIDFNGDSPKLQSILAERKEAEETAVIEYEKTLSEIESEIREVPDLIVREIMLYRYADFMSWGQIAGRMYMSPSACRMILTRWLDKNCPRK